MKMGDAIVTCFSIADRLARDIAINGKMINLHETNKRKKERKVNSIIPSASMPPKL